MIFYQVILLIIFSMFFINPAFADVNDLVMMLPNEDELSNSWEIGKISIGENIETEVSEHKLNVVKQTFTLHSAASSMSAELNIFEFDSSVEATQAYDNYAEFLSKKFELRDLEGDGISACFGIVKNFGFVNEMTGVFCTKKSYLIISTAQQDGRVFEGNKQILTDNVAIDFIGFVVQDMEKLSESQIPTWVKNNALWWGQNKIEDNDFVSGLQFLIQKNIIKVNTSTYTESNEIPPWIKNTALWWGEGQISDTEFIKSLEFLIENSFIKI